MESITVTTDNPPVEFSEAADLDEPDLNLFSINEKDGRTVLCDNEACTEENRKRMGHFPGGGIGGQFRCSMPATPRAVKRNSLAMATSPEA